MVNSVLRMLVPFSFMSTARMPLVLAVFRLALTESIVKAYGARHVTLALPAVMTVVSSESAMQNSAGMAATFADLTASMGLTSATVGSIGLVTPGVWLPLIVSAGPAEVATSLPVRV